MKFDYNEYDSLSLLIKAKESEKLLSYYRSFGWEEYERREDRRYFDILHIKLKRRHKIPNKDRLQLLQVEMESTLNRFALLRKKKHSRFLKLSLALAFLALSLCSLAVLLLYFNLLLPLGISLLALVILSPVFVISPLKRLFENENGIYAVKFKEMTSAVSRIIAQAERLLSGNERI